MRTPLLLILAALAAFATPASGAEESRTLLVRGRVSGPEGWPAAKVTVAASGTRSASALTDGQGRYALYLPMPTLRGISGARFAVRITPVKDGWTFARAGGRGAAGLEVDIVGSPTRARVRAPDAAFAGAVVTALTARSVSVVFADLDFIGAPTTAGRAEAAIEMTTEVMVPVSGVRPTAGGAAAPKATPLVRAQTPRADSVRPAPATAAPIKAVSPPAPRRLPSDSLRDVARAAMAREERVRAAERAARAERARIERARRDSVHAARVEAARRDSSGAAKTITPVAPSSVGDKMTTPVAPPSAGEKMTPSLPPAAVPDTSLATAAPPPAPDKMTPPPADTCACVVKGTIEARSDRRIPEYLRVVVWLADRPASRDSVELFMGSPRSFEMRAPCGTHRFEMRVEPRLQRYTPAPPEAFQDFTCVRTPPSQWRLVVDVK